MTSSLFGWESNATTSTQSAEMRFMTILHTRGPSQRSNKRSKPSPNADTDGTGDACCCNDVLSSSPDAQGVSNRRFAPPFPQPSPRWIPSAERRSAVQREAGGRHVAPAHESTPRREHDSRRVKTGSTRAWEGWLCSPLRNARLEEAGEDGFERPSSTARHASASGRGSQ